MITKISVKHGLHVLYAFLAAAIPVLVASDSFRSFLEHHGLSAAAFALRWQLADGGATAQGRCRQFPCRAADCTG